MEAREEGFEARSAGFFQQNLEQKLKQDLKTFRIYLVLVLLLCVLIIFLEDLQIIGIIFFPLISIVGLLELKTRIKNYQQFLIPIQFYMQADYQKAYDWIQDYHHKRGGGNIELIEKLQIADLDLILSVIIQYQKNGRKFPKTLPQEEYMDVLFNIEKYEIAIPVINKMLQRDPYKIQWLLMKGEALIATATEIQESIIPFNQVLNLDPNNIDAIEQLLFCYEELNDRGNYKIYWEHLNKLAPDRASKYKDCLNP